MLLRFKGLFLGSPDWLLPVGEGSEKWFSSLGEVSGVFVFFYKVVFCLA